MIFSENYITTTEAEIKKRKYRNLRYARYKNSAEMQIKKFVLRKITVYCKVIT